MWTSLFWLSLGIMTGAAVVHNSRPPAGQNPIQRRLHMQGLILFLFLSAGLLFLNSPAIRGLEPELQGENPAELALLVKSINENKNALQEELSGLQKELEHTKALVENGDSLTDSVNARIQVLMLATGSQSVCGPGLSITFREQSNLMYYDIIDLVNELFLSGAEAVAINGERLTSRSSIGEKASTAVRFNNETGRYVTDTFYAITLNEKELHYPLCIQAIGNAATLEKGLDYPGGILQSLSALYGLSPQLLQSPEIIIPAASPAEFIHATPIEK